MPDLSTRTERERELTAAVWLLLQDEAARIEGGGAPNWPAFERRLAAAMDEPLAKSHGEAAAAMWLLLIEDPTNRPDQSAIDAGSAKWAGPMAAAIAAGMVDNIRAEYAAARKTGNAAAALAVIFGQSRAENIGITETTRAVSQGERQVTRRFERLPDGRTMIGIWQAEIDSRTCPVCRPLHNQRPEVWERQFPSGPPAHPRCRCYLSWQAVGGSSDN